MARNPGVTGRVGAQAARRAFNLRFVGETLSELRRVTWPNRQETMRLTLVVLSVSAAVGIFLGLVDLSFSRLMDVVLR